MDNLKKNQYVKSEITKALLELLKEKDLNEISIREITTRSQVGRVSFYRNYKRKEDILEQYLFFIIKEWGESNTDSLSMDKLLKKLFEHLVSYRDFYTLLYTKGLLYLFKDTLKRLITKDQELPNVAAYSVAFVSYGIYGWIEEWIARGMQESADEIYNILISQKNMPQ